MFSLTQIHASRTRVGTGENAVFKMVVPYVTAPEGTYLHSVSTRYKENEGKFADKSGSTMNFKIRYKIQNMYLSLSY